MSQYISMSPRGICLIFCLYFSLFYKLYVHADANTVVFTCDSWVLNLVYVHAAKHSGFTHSYKQHCTSLFSFFKVLSVHQQDILLFKAKWVIAPNSFCIYFAVLRHRSLAALTVSIIKKTRCHRNPPSQSFANFLRCATESNYLSVQKSIPHHRGSQETNSYPELKLKMINAVVTLYSKGFAQE